MLVTVAWSPLGTPSALIPVIWASILGTNVLLTTAAPCFAGGSVASFAVASLRTGSAFPQISLAFATNAALVIAGAAVDFALLELPPQPAAPITAISMPATTILAYRPGPEPALVGSVGTDENGRIIEVSSCVA